VVVVFEGPIGAVAAVLPRRMRPRNRWYAGVGRIDEPELYLLVRSRRIDAPVRARQARDPF